MFSLLRFKKLMALGVALATLIVLGAAPPAQGAFVINIYDGATLIGTSTVSSTTPVNIASAMDANFSASIVVAMTNDPGNPSLASLIITDQSVIRMLTGGTHTLTVDVTDTGYTLPAGSPMLLTSSAGGSYIGTTAGSSVSATFRSWLDAGNMEFGGVNGGPAPSGPALTPGGASPLQTASLGAPSPLGTSQSLVYSPGTATNTVNRSGAFSLSNRATFAISSDSPNGGDSVNVGTSTTAMSEAVPAPAGIALVLTGVPFLGVGAWLRRRAKVA